ncbi:hypothetical protein F2Q70_00040413 [Brassica cretica]|uniref:Disease resistance protein RPS4B/Roq1-like leucine-rich repeats domain-containing protein n=1 Tax=Brassica cretica TaxID=69181 RepID=A0A8S9K6Q8_BRACR|nr:hypothetical protein F2Q70_00040413 [Brassica cretica]
MQETLVVELPESFGNLSKLVTLKMLKKPLFRSCESDSTPSFVEVPSSFSNLLLLEELDARSWGISSKIPDVLEKLSHLKILKLGNNYFHSLPSSLEGLLNLRELSLYDCRELKSLPPVPCNLEQLNLANCFSLERISDLSKLKALHELNLTNCDKVDDIPGLEHLKALKRLYMSGCNSECSFKVKKRLSKASLKMMANLSLPGNRIPDWFSQGPLRYSTQPNRELRGVILAVVVALNHERKDDYQLPDVVEVQAKILKLDLALYTHTLHLSGVPRTSDDQLHICRYSAMHPMVTMFKDGYTIQVTKRDPPVKQGVELKMHGIHLVYEGDDDFKGEESESDFTETQFTVSQKLANFFSTFGEGEANTPTNGMLASLEELNLTATALKNLPSSIGKLKNLQKLYLMHCASLSKLPDTINELKSLKKLFINGSAVEELPLNPGSLPSLTDFSAGGCKHLKQVPSSIGGLNSLLDLELDWTPIETLPKEIGDLHFIRKLVLRNCKSLKVLPESLGDMDTLHSLCLEGSNIEKLPESFGKLENLVLLRMNNCKKIKRLPESFGDLKSLHHLFMQETLVVELPESFGNLSKLVTLKMLKKPLFRSYARSWGIGGKIPDVLGKLSSLKILKLGNNYFHSLPSSLEGLLNLRELSLYDCRELKCLPPLPCNLEQLNLANCFSLESISDLSKLKILHELNLANCKKVDDISGLEHLKALKRLYMSDCNSKCSSEVKKRLSKASLKMMVNLILPGNRIPVWFSQGPLRYTTQPNRELRGVILAVVVALNHESKDDYQLPDVVEVQAQFLKLDLALYTYTLHLSGVPRTSDDQLHICRYSAMHPMVTMFKDGYTIHVTKREPPVKQGVELKMHGIHLVYEGDDDFKGEESDFTETQKLANFFSTFEEGEASSKGGSEFT